MFIHRISVCNILKDLFFGSFYFSSLISHGFCWISHIIFFQLAQSHYIWSPNATRSYTLLSNLAFFFLFSIDSLLLQSRSSRSHSDLTCANIRTRFFQNFLWISASCTLILQHFWFNRLLSLRIHFIHRICKFTNSTTPLSIILLGYWFLI